MNDYDTDQDEFASGLDAAFDAQDAGDGAALPAAAAQEVAGEVAGQEAPSGAPAGATPQTPADWPTPETALPEAGEARGADTPDVAPDDRAQAPEAPGQVEAPQGLEDELERLRQLNPAAAALALEDSDEGEGLRRRLETYGAEIAQDRAERVLEARAAAHQAQARERQAVAEHNRQFMATLEQAHPDYVALLKDTGRRGELAAFQRDLMDWIGRQPYHEGARLMEIAQRGRDPKEVCGLLSSFKRARQGKRPDPTAALVAPGRGAFAAPPGIGDADDFNAGFDAGLTSELSSR